MGMHGYAIHNFRLSTFALARYAYGSIINSQKMENSLHFLGSLLQ
jgi:hypothetical protein